MDYDIHDPGLAGKGKLRIEWAAASMPVLNRIGERFAAEKPLRGVKVSACLHVTTETGNLMTTLKAGGADVRLCASNPLSTQDDVASSLVKDYGISVFAKRGVDTEGYYNHIRGALAFSPQITMDDGADLVFTIHSEMPELAGSVIGGTEETTTGVIRLRSMAKEGALGYPIIAVNDALTKHLFDNRYGTGQSTLDGILRSTNMLLAGSKVVICGYGWCGRGVATRARGMGANVIVTEVDPLKGLEAIMDGFQVMPMAEAVKIGDLFITLTGNKSVIAREHFGAMKDGAIVCNSGHFNVEIDIEALERIKTSKRRIRGEVDEYGIGGRRIYLLGEGRLINLAAAEGHPASVMDMSFADQALSLEYLVTSKAKLAPGVYPVPPEIDREVARLKLAALGVRIDVLTEEQRAYLASWKSGT
ncbi:MAG: adenosylhomocysteinase [Candidatus Eisenbacteria bacterium]